MKTKYGYVILWRGKQYEKEITREEFHAVGQCGTYRIREDFCDEHRIRPSKRHEVTVILAEKNGEPVVHSATGL